MSGPSELPIGEELTEFPGRSFNLLVREWYRQRGQLARGARGASTPGSIGVVKAKNTTGSALNYGHCVAIEGLAIAYADKADQQYARPLLKAQKHTSSLHHAILGAALTSVEDQQPGSFIVSGVAWIRCNVTDNAHYFAELQQNQTPCTELAKSSTSGYPILDRESTDTGEQWALVLLGGGGGGGGSSSLVFCYAAGDISGATGLGIVDAGGGSVTLVNDDGTDGTTVDVINRYYSSILDQSPGYVEQTTNGYETRDFDCKTTPSTA